MMFKKVRKHLKVNSDRKKNLKLRDGGDILDCIEEDGVYEIQDPSLMLTIREVLKVERTDIFIFVKSGVLFLSYVVNQKVKNIIFHYGINFGVDLYFCNLSTLSLKVLTIAGIGIGVGLATQLSVFFSTLTLNR